MKIVTNVKRIARNIRFILTADLADESKGQTKLWKKHQILEHSIEKCEKVVEEYDINIEEAVSVQMDNVEFEHHIEEALDRIDWDEQCQEAMNNYDSTEDIRIAIQDYDIESDIEERISDTDWSTHIGDFLSSKVFKDLLIDSSEDPIDEAIQKCVDAFDFSDLSESMNESARECISDMLNKKLSKCLKVLAATLEVEDFEDEDDDVKLALDAQDKKAEIDLASDPLLTIL